MARGQRLGPGKDLGVVVHRLDVKAVHGQVHGFAPGTRGQVERTSAADS
jgi:hypothetical protein